MEMRIEGVNEENKKFIIWLINEAETSKKKTLQDIRNYPTRYRVDRGYSIIAMKQEQTALFKYALGNPISEVKKSFEEAAKFWEKYSKNTGFISAVPVDGMDAMCSGVISSNLDLTKRIASMIGHESDKDQTWPEVRFSVYALRDLILNRNRGVLENVSKIEEKERSIEFYYQGQMCESIVQEDLRLLQDSLEELLKKHDNLVKYGSYRAGRDSRIGKVEPEGYFSIPAVAITKLAKEKGLEVKIENIPEKLRQYLPMELVE